MIWLICVESVVQVKPHMKYVRRGSEHGSMVKFHDATHDHGVMDEGLIEALKALRASMSEDEVRDCTRKLVWKVERQMVIVRQRNKRFGILKP